jgi:ABC-type uncharacterized transport system auxiliary subunit
VSPSQTPAAPARRAAALARPAVVIAAAAAAVAALAGCGTLNRELSQQHAVVTFHVGTATSVVEQVRHSCSHIRHVTLIRRPAGSRELRSVRYVVSKASPANLEALRSCLSAFPDVTGVNILDTANQGL